MEQNTNNSEKDKKQQNQTFDTKQQEQAEAIMDKPAETENVEIAKKIKKIDDINKPSSSRDSGLATNPQYKVKPSIWKIKNIDNQHLCKFFPPEPVDLDLPPVLRNFFQACQNKTDVIEKAPEKSTKDVSGQSSAAPPQTPLKPELQQTLKKILITSPTNRNNTNSFACSEPNTTDGIEKAPARDVSEQSTAPPKTPLKFELQQIPSSEPNFEVLSSLQLVRTPLPNRRILNIDGSILEIEVEEGNFDIQKPLASETTNANVQFQNKGVQLPECSDVDQYNAKTKEENNMDHPETLKLEEELDFECVPEDVGEDDINEEDYPPVSPNSEYNLTEEQLRLLDEALGPLPE